jgi:hypothetical protein
VSWFSGIRRDSDCEPKLAADFGSFSLIAQAAGQLHIVPSVRATT